MRIHALDTTRNDSQKDSPPYPEPRVGHVTRHIIPDGVSPIAQAVLWGPRLL